MLKCNFTFHLQVRIEHHLNTLSPNQEALPQLDFLHAIFRLSLQVCCLMGYVVSKELKWLVDQTTAAAAAAAAAASDGVIY